MSREFNCLWEIRPSLKLWQLTCHHRDGNVSLEIQQRRESLYLLLRKMQIVWREIPRAISPPASTLPISAHRLFPCPRTLCHCWETFKSIHDSHMLAIFLIHSGLEPYTIKSKIEMANIKAAATGCHWFTTCIYLFPHRYSRRKASLSIGEFRNPWSSRVLKINIEEFKMWILGPREVQ